MTKVSELLEAIEFLTGNIAKLNHNSICSSATPVGTIVAYNGDVLDIPNGWLVCDGQALAQSEYVELFAAIGANWGHGDGPHTFNLPKLSGQFIRVDSHKVDSANMTTFFIIKAMGFTK